jgi:hypothetical protein
MIFFYFSFSKCNISAIVCCGYVWAAMGCLVNSRLKQLQGEKIERIVLGDNLLWAVFVNYRSPNLEGPFFPRKKWCIIISTKMVWATFWAIFFTTNLVTLNSCHVMFPSPSTSKLVNMNIQRKEELWLQPFVWARLFNWIELGRLF